MLDPSCPAAAILQNQEVVLLLYDTNKRCEPSNWIGLGDSLHRWHVPSDFADSANDAPVEADCSTDSADCQREILLRGTIRVCQFKWITISTSSSDGVLDNWMTSDAAGARDASCAGGDGTGGDSCRGCTGRSI